MLTLDSLNPDKPLFVFLAIGFAEKALPIWEEENPEDMMPREAIEAAKAWLSNPSKYAAYAARSAAAYAADAAYAASAASAAYAARSAAAYAAYAAYAARSAAAYAAYAAAYALNADKKSLIHEVILENLDWILQHKIENRQSFANPELILDYLTEEQKQRFLFNLDAMT